MRPFLFLTLVCVASAFAAAVAQGQRNVAGEGPLVRSEPGQADLQKHGWGGGYGGYGRYGGYGWYGGYWADPWWGPCYPPYGCGPLAWSEAQRRERQRLEAIRREAAAAKESAQSQDIWGAEGIWGYTRRLPPPTDEAQIRPEYREAGRMRPEFEQFGEHRDAQ